MQLNMPSVVHAVPAAIADPVPVLAGAAEEAMGVALEATALDFTTEDATGAAEVATGAEADVATVTKTPPWPAEVALEAAAEVALEATEVTTEAPDPDPAEAAPVAPATAAPQDGPVGATGFAVAVPKSSRESPGFGNIRSVESTVPQDSWGIFATNMFGRAL